MSLGLPGAVPVRGPAMLRLPVFVAALCSLVLSTAPSPRAQGPSGRPEWDDPAVLHVGTEPPHATMMVYPSADLALGGDPARSPWFRSLNGTWKLRWSPNPSARPADFWREDARDEGWSDVKVPGSLETQGFGMPVYVNIGYVFPFDEKAPRPPSAENPVASYRTRFDLPAEWDGRRVLLHFDGVDSAVVRLGERHQGRVQRGRADADGVRRDARGASRLEPAGRGGLPLQRRIVPGGPGYVPPERDLPRRVPLEPGRAAHSRLRGEDRSRQPARRRDARGTGATGGQRDARHGGHRRSRAARSVGRPCRLGVPPCPSRGERGRHARRLQPARAPAAGVVGRDAGSVHPAAHAAFRLRAGARGRPVARRLPRGVDCGREDAPQRSAHSLQGGQPPRAPPGDGPLRRPRDDGARHRADEAAQRQRGADLALPEHAALVRARGPVRPLRGRRGQHRVPRLRVGPEEPPHERPGLDRGLRRSHDAHGRARQEPPLRRHLVDGQRVRRRPELRRHLQVDEGARRVPAGALRGQQQRGRPELRHQLVHVPHPAADRGAGGEAAGDAPAALRIHARDGEQQRRPAALLGPLLLGAQHARRVRVGLGEPGHPAERAAAVPGWQRPWHVPGLRRLVGRPGRPAQRRELQPERPDQRRPDPLPRPAGDQVRLPLPARQRGRSEVRPDRGAQLVRLPERPRRGVAVVERQRQRQGPAPGHGRLAGHSTR